MLVSRAVGLHKSLVSPIALLNCVAWLPLLEPNSTWYAKQCDQWWFLLRLRPRPSKGYQILTWLNFETWELSGVQQILNFIFQMTQAPRGSFLAALLSELRSECILSPKSWLFGAVRLLSRALAFPRAACLLARVDNMLEHIRESNMSSLRDIFREKYLKAIRHAAYDRLAGIPRGPYRKLRVLREWIDGAGRLSSIFDVSQWSSSCLHFISLLMLGELPVHRVRAYYAQRRSLGNFRRSRFCKRACLHCLITGDMLVLDSEWHWIFDCPHFGELRMKLPVFERTLRSCRTSDRGFALAEDLVSLLKNVQIEYRVAVSLGSFIRQAIALRESWISEVCARGRLCKPPDHWSRNLFQDPPSDAEFPAEIAEKFDDGQPWYNATDELSCGELWRALDEDM